MNTTIERSAKAANAIGGKTARACENCLVKRARWFCTADDAFLCQACDSSVHSANQLASKHERFRLGTSSSYKIDHHHNPSSSSSSPSWHQGFTKKARTPRFRPLQPSIGNNPNTDPIVPEINSIEEWRPFHPYDDQNEEQSVPVFPPSFEDDFDCVKLLGTEEGFLGDDDHCLDIGDVDFSVGNMLEEDNASCGISRLVDLGLEIRSSAVNNKAKEEEEDEDSDEEVQAAIASCHVDDNPQLDIEFDWDFDDYNSTKQTKGEGIKSESDILDEATRVSYDHGNNSISNNMKLKLNYEAVMESWESQDNSPWIDGVRPHHFSIDDFTVSSMRGIVGLRWGAEREARVMRYKEKRRTRLFSKKIRYQVRKLNAQKRPRIKGRFVKRSSMVAMSAFSGISFP